MNQLNEIINEKRLSPVSSWSCALGRLAWLTNAGFLSFSRESLVSFITVTAIGGSGKTTNNRRK